VDHIHKDDNVLIIDTTFRAGRLVNDVVGRLKEALRRNLSHGRVRVDFVIRGVPMGLRSDRTNASRDAQYCI